MKIPVSPTVNISYRNAFLTFLVILLLTIYCRFVNLPLIIPVLVFFCGLHLFLFKKARLKLFLQLGFFLTIVLFAADYLTHYTAISPLYIPLASIVMLTLLLFNDLQVAFIMSFMSAMLLSLSLGGGMSTALVFFIGNLTAAYTVQDARTRGHLIAAGIYVGILQVAGLILFHPDINFIFSKDFLMFYLQPLMFSGIGSAFVVMATLKIFELWFGVLTNFSLLELADKDHPLLRRMSLEAPGTYHHSLLVSDLSESAANAVGANTLLTRVGAYYHDIGKLEKAEYFTENQLGGVNKHDDIEPSVSRLVILNHVKEGIELARKHKLNARIIDFIPEHHGTSLMHYFYQRALQDATEPEAINEENYRYPGPKPQSRETAIVLLADSVEGATRALEDPTPKKIEDVVRKVINNKFIDGQLDECNLTLRDITLITDTFTRVLSAIYHVRVKYPEQKDEGKAAE